RDRRALGAAPRGRARRAPRGRPGVPARRCRVTWGIIPAAGIGSPIQPLAFSKELLPVGSSPDPGGVARPRARSDDLVERMIRGGATKICFVISPTKSDIVGYYGGGLERASGEPVGEDARDGIARASFAYVVQQAPAGLCDAIFCALPVLA